MIISSSLTVGQITFILRVVIQVLSYGGIFLLGLIILGNAPRIAPIETHDVINRVVGQSTVTLASLKWIVKRLVGRDRERVPSFQLLLALLFFILYALFVSLSDIGFLGFHACTIPAPTFLDYPASVKIDQDARTVLAANLLNGTDPSSVRLLRCDAAEEVVFSVNVTERNCTAWYNSTYADPTAFQNLNTTDSDVLMPRQLAKYIYRKSEEFYLNMYYRRIGGQKVPRPLVTNGLAIAPHETGVKMVIGVPQLSKQQRVEIPKTLALEVDMGCMALGIYGQRNPSSVASDISFDFFATNGSWRKYTGPEYLSDVLSQTVDNVRQAMLPLFNASDIDANGYIFSYNGSQSLFTLGGSVRTYYLPQLSTTVIDRQAGFNILSNCSQHLHAQLGLPIQKSGWNNALPSACGMFEIGGSGISDGAIFQGLSRMVCATATQVNMVSATVEMDAVGSVGVSTSRLPSSLNIVEANYWEVLHNVPEPGSTTFNNWDNIQRFTLADNATGPLDHFIFQEFTSTGTDLLDHGTGSSGLVFSTVGSRMLSSSQSDDDSIGAIDGEYYQGNFSTAKVTKWGGGVGASYLLASVGYNGWAARASQSLSVVSTGGQPATCFKPQYGIAFLPLFVAGFLVLCWALIIITTSTLFGAKRLEGLYGGMNPYIKSVSPTDLPPETLLVWENPKQPHLNVVVDGRPVESDRPGVLVAYMERK